MEKSDLKGKTLLEIGCGSALLSIVAGRTGAIPTAIDISSLAVETAKKNFHKNSVTGHVIQSDLFENVPPVIFDFIAINPPYYRGKAGSEAEMAWYCGEDLDFFRRLFARLPEFMHSATKVWMILSDQCETKNIESIAMMNGLSFLLIHQRKYFLEINYIYQISRSMH